MDGTNTTTETTVRKTDGGYQSDGVRFILRSGNSKTGSTATTCVDRRSCPKSCPLWGCCYAKDLRSGIVPSGEGCNPEGLARTEAELIRLGSTSRAAKGRPMRLHVSGDCASPDAARVVGDACRSWPGPVWTYTHGWREGVTRDAWGPAVSVMGSCERPEDLATVDAAGYAPAMVVAVDPGKAQINVQGWTLTVCPAQRRGVTCEQCGLCFKSDKLRASKRGIAFIAHGSRPTMAGAKKNRHRVE